MVTELTEQRPGLFGSLTRPFRMRFPRLFEPLWRESPYETHRRESRLFFLGPIGAIAGMVAGVLSTAAVGLPPVLYVPLTTLAGFSAMVLATNVETFLRVHGQAHLGRRALIAEVTMDFFGGGILASMIAAATNSDVAVVGAVGGAIIVITGAVRRTLMGGWIDDTIRILTGDAHDGEAPDYSAELRLLSEGRIDDAIHAFRDRSRERGGHPGPLVQAAQLLRERRIYGRAVELYAEALEARDLDARRGSAFARQIRAICHEELDDPDEAIAHLERLVERFPDASETEWAWKELTVGMSLSHSDEVLGTHASRVPAVRAVERILSEALVAGASDIHMEDYPDGLRVRYRIDGVLQDAKAPPRRIRSAVLARVRVMGGLNPGEHPVPRDARIRVPFAGRDVDIRVSTVPTMHGESVALRILDTERGRLTLSDLGLRDDQIARLLDAAARPNGMILATGPGGSGKSTTLHSIIREISTGREKIFTVEDPVEYTLEGVCQVSVNERAGLTFASALRSLIRQDPDVLLIGEARDHETAEIAMHASLTGHLVLSTLHTMDAISSLHRLEEIGVEPYMAVHTLEAAVAQRLVRRVCPHCAHEVPLHADDIEALGVTADPPSHAMVGDGCDRCRHTGYSGRIGIYETLWMNDDLRHAFLARAPRSELRQIARANGTLSLRDDGVEKIRAGITTPLEVLRVTTL